MTQLLLHGPAADEMIARRRELGIDTYDELWDGVYHVTPVGNGEHGALQAGLMAMLRGARPTDTAATGPINLGNEHNYRVPDAAVINLAHRSLVWVPSAVLVGEVVSPDDDTYEKFGHYEAHGVEEILVVDPRRQCVEIWQRQELGGYTKVRRSALLAGCSDDVIWAQITSVSTGHYVEVPDCKIVHPYGEDGWRPLSNGNHEHWIEYRVDPGVLMLPWRTGRKLGRTIYAVLGEEPSDDDPLLGLVDDPAVARHICAVHNADL